MISPELGGGCRLRRRPGSRFTIFMLFPLLFSPLLPSSIPDLGVSGDSESSNWARRNAPSNLTAFSIVKDPSRILLVSDSGNDKSDDLGLHRYLCSCLAGLFGFRSEVAKILLRDYNTRSGVRKLRHCSLRKERYTFITPIVWNINSKFPMDFGALHGLSSVMIKVYFSSGDCIRRVALSCDKGSFKSHTAISSLLTNPLEVKFVGLRACLSGVIRRSLLSIHVRIYCSRWMLHLRSWFFSSKFIVVHGGASYETGSRVHLSGKVCKNFSPFYPCTSLTAQHIIWVQTLILGMDLWANKRNLELLFKYGPLDPSISKPTISLMGGEFSIPLKGKLGFGPIRPFVMLSLMYGLTSHRFEPSYVRV